MAKIISETPLIPHFHFSSFMYEIYFLHYFIHEGKVGIAVYQALSWRLLTGCVAAKVARLAWVDVFKGVSTPMKSISTSEPYFCLSNWPFLIPLAMWELMEWSEPEGLRCSSNDVTWVTLATERRWWSNRPDVHVLRSCVMTYAERESKIYYIYICFELMWMDLMEYDTERNVERIGKKY